MTTIRFVPPRLPLVDVRTGMITREWYLFLQALFSPTTAADTTDTELAAMSLPSGAEAMNYALMQELRQVPLSVNDQIAELAKAVEGLGIAP